MTGPNIAKGPPPQISSRARVTEILARYPDISAQEGEEVVCFLKRGPLLDIGVIAGDEQLKPKFKRFWRDHAHALSTSWKTHAIIALSSIAFILALAFLFWDSGVG